MNRDTITIVLPALTEFPLKNKGFLIENIFTELWLRSGIKTILNRSGFTKPSGIASLLAMARTCINIDPPFYINQIC